MERDPDLARAPARARGLRTRTEFLRALLGGIVAVTVFQFPALAHLAQRIPAGSPDALAESWSITWVGHALRTQPSRIFDANAFWPSPDALARSDVLLGYGPLALFGHGTTTVVFAYGAAFLLAYVLAFAGAFALASELRLGTAGAVVAALAFAYAPWRLSQQSHLQVLSSAGVPFTLFFLARGYRTQRPLLIAAACLAACWQVSIGFSVGLPLLYLLLALGCLSVARMIRRGDALPWLRRSRMAPVTVVCAATLAAVALLVAAPYEAVLASQPRPPVSAVAQYSAPLRGILVAPRESAIWGYRMVGLRDSLGAPEEESLFPGLAVAALALVGIALGPWRRAWRVGLGVATLWLYLASLGYGVAGGWLAYRLIQHLPGWSGLRVPGRLMTLTTLGLALLAGAGAAALARWFTQRPGLTRDRSLLRGWLVVGASVLAVGAEGFGPAPAVVVPSQPEPETSVADPVLHLPGRFYIDPLYMFWSATAGFPRIVNGQAAALPASLFRIYRATYQFPDRRSVAYLRTLGVRTVILHPKLSLLTPWWHAERRQTAGLGITRRRAAADFVYSLGPPR